ncbi:MAG: phytanoyl-CoA dioxygenase family protein [Pseudomonadota bacterium]
MTIMQTITPAAHSIDYDLDRIRYELDRLGYCVVENVLSSAQLEGTVAAMYRARTAIHAELGLERLEAAGEAGILRLMCKFEPSFLELLEAPLFLDVLDAALSPTSVMHLQQGIILEPENGGTGTMFQNSWHPDFTRLLNGYRASINFMVAVTDYTRETGATHVLPGSHQKPRPPADILETYGIPVEAPAGSVIIFDSTLWHKSGRNTSGADRLAINHQFTCSWFKQQIDYVRALDESLILSLPQRTQQMLGYFTRVPTSLDEYYQPPEKRLYRAGQG